MGVMEREKKPSVEPENSGQEDLVLSAVCVGHADLGHRDTDMNAVGCVQEAAGSGPAQREGRLNV